MLQARWDRYGCGKNRLLSRARLGDALMDSIRISDRSTDAQTSHGIRLNFGPVHLESTPHTREANVWIWI